MNKRAENEERRSKQDNRAATKGVSCEAGEGTGDERKERSCTGDEAFVEGRKRAYEVGGADGDEG